ncbi:uncharacterized protein PITG_10273 [Phytophthora infestans T30-4]|uniref:N-acetyltransferase domain-containing protein n=1 Tax=Phytophthora infestans (strain T30-4) TaxID=403677 RepID=D0NEY2_PHYIT|nr:uncharacterized protein PITG_10273 [Phytophthora infestans T30-4]EEY56771.1 conserved hypothetical protein [Phytophthora infestans T30-4]|eukprot:XP_002902099.1 conserved hypothetical protein [Phytophthora infestans T30-4]
MTVATSTIIKVRQYRPEDHAQVTKVYVEGLMACDPDPKYCYLWEELLRKDLTNDLADIEGSHIAPGGNFLIRRVYVDPKYQRMSAFYAALGYTKVDEGKYSWTDPLYLPVVKFVKQL